METTFNPVEAFELRVLHVGINAQGEADAERIAKEFETLMGFIPKFGNSSIFASPLIEIMKNNGRGEKGHIAFGTPDVDKVLAYLQEKGLHVAEETVKKDEAGRTKFAYVQEQLGGFAIHFNLV